MKTYKVGDECPGCNEYRCPRELIEAQSEVARLRAALEFYADHASWAEVTPYGDEKCPDVFDDLGDRARAALAAK